MMIASVLAIVEIILMILVLFLIESKRKITLKRNSLWKFVESKIQILIISLVKLKIFHCTKNLLQKKRTFMRRQGGLRKIILNVLQLVHKNRKKLKYEYLNHNDYIIIEEAIEFSKICPNHLINLNFCC